MCATRGRKAPRRTEATASPLHLVSNQRPRPQLLTGDYLRAERSLIPLIEEPGLEERLARWPWAGKSLTAVVRQAIELAFGRGPGAPEAHRFLQRTLYRINRLMLFWYDDLHAYENDRSPFLLDLRARIERAWQSWMMIGVDEQQQSSTAVVASLRQRFARDVSPPLSAAGLYFRDHATLIGYCQLVKIGSLDGLVEASQLSRTLGGVSNDIHSTLTRLLMEEYGGGRPTKQHSAHYRAMMDALGLNPTPEAHFESVPWEVLAGINHSFLLSDRKRLFLRYVGGLLYTEISVPAAFQCYRAAAERLGLPAAAMTYWDLHIREDARHGLLMLEEVALPLAARYPNDAGELLLGYDQQRAISAVAGAATARAAFAA